MMKSDIASMLERQQNRIEEITRDVIAELVLPRLDVLDGEVKATKYVIAELVLPRLDVLDGEVKATKAASENAHNSIQKTLDDIIARLERIENRE